MEGVVTSLVVRLDHDGRWRPLFLVVTGVRRLTSTA
jgi:hypothetical protein